MNIRRTVITGAAALALVAGGTLAGAVAFASSGTVYRGCVVGTSRTMEQVYTRANPPACTSGFRATWNQVGQQGPQGPSGIVSMLQFNTGGTAAVTSSVFQFIGSPVEVNFADSHTAAEVTATVDISGDNNGANFPVTATIGICYAPVGQSSPTQPPASQVDAAGYSPSAQTVSAIVRPNLSGNYNIGACEANASSTNLANGPAGVGTIIMAETASGVASPAQHRPGQHG